MSKALTILLADDDEEDLAFFAEALAELALDTKLKTVKNGSALMDYLEAHVKDLPDCLFLDLNMPRKNGFECLKEIKASPLYANLPVIIYSTSYHKEIVNQLIKQGAMLCLRKPSDYDELKNVIAGALQKLQVAEKKVRSVRKNRTPKGTK